MNIDTARELVNFFEIYDRHFKELRMFILKKQDKVAADDLIWLLDSLNEEQKLIMRGNSLEAKRIAFLNSSGFKDYKSAELINESPDEYKGKFRVLLDSINDNVHFIKNTNEDILDLIEKKIEVQEELLNETGFAGTNTYTSKGAKIHKGNDVGGDIIGTV